MRQMDESKGLTESRTTRNIAKESTTFIEDIVNSDVLIIDDL